MCLHHLPRHWQSGFAHGRHHLAADATELESAGGAGERYTPIFEPKVEIMYREESTASEEESGGGNCSLYYCHLRSVYCDYFTAKFCIYDAEELVNSHNSSVGKNVNQATIIIVRSIDCSLQNNKLKKFHSYIYF